MALYMGKLHLYSIQVLSPPLQECQPPRPFVWIWDSKCANKIKVFTWLLLMDRLNVRNILRRKKHKLQDNNYNCVICSSQCEETTYSSPALLVQGVGSIWASSGGLISVSFYEGRNEAVIQH
jgi:hypothetical protein